MKKKICIIAISHVPPAPHCIYNIYLTVFCVFLFASSFLVQPVRNLRKQISYIRG